MTPQEVAFRAWCDRWYRDHYGEDASVCFYTERHDQKQRGDVRVVASGTAHNYDEKCYLTVWNGCLIELLQESTPNGDTLHPISLGWFYELTDCHYLLCGFYDGFMLAEVYRISMRRLRAHYRDMMMVTTPWKARAVVSRAGWGITVAVVIPWELMQQYQCAAKVETMGSCWWKHGRREGARDAEAVRGDAGRVQGGGDARGGGEDEGGAHLQRDAEARAATGDGETRAVTRGRR